MQNAPYRAVAQVNRRSKAAQKERSAERQDEGGFTRELEKPQERIMQYDTGKKPNPFSTEADYYWYDKVTDGKRFAIDALVTVVIVVSGVAVVLAQSAMMT